MSEALTVPGRAMPPTPPGIIEKIRLIEAKMRPHEHTLRVRTEHVIHGGMYVRTIKVAPRMAFTSVLVKIPTILVVNGKCCIFAGDGWYQIDGYQVIPASAGRKQIYVTLGPTEITMTFPTDAKTVEEAEAQFTDEAESLITRRQEGNDLITITGH